MGTMRMNESPVWLRKVEDELLEFVSSSGGSHCPEFPLESFSKSLSKTLHTPHFSIQLGAKEWRTQDNLLSGLGKAPLSLSLELSPLEGDLFWIMPYEDICKWVSWLKSEDQKSFDLENPDLIKGIYTSIFVCIQFNRIFSRRRKSKKWCSLI